MKISEFFFEVPFLPVPWSAPQRSGGRYYNPRHEEKEKSREYLKSFYTPFLVSSAPVSLELHFFLPIPKSLSEKKRREILSKRIVHIKKPDVDNLTKFICDCMKGIFFKDDNQIFKLCAQKHYSENPRTEITLNFHVPPFDINESLLD